MIWQDPDAFPERWNHRAKAFSNGRLDFTYAVPGFKEAKNLLNARYFVRIAAHGYEPFMSEPMKLTAESFQLEAQLVRSAGKY